MRALRILRAISRWCFTAWRSSPSAARAVESYAVSRRSRSGNGPKILIDVAFGSFATGASRDEASCRYFAQRRQYLRRSSRLNVDCEDDEAADGERGMDADQYPGDPHL